MNSHHRPIRLFLVGWHGNGAHGDDLLAYCLQMLFSTCAKKAKLTIEWTQDPQQSDYIIVGGGTLLGIDTMGIYDLLRHCRKRFSVFGTGFRRERRDIGKGNTEKLRWILETADLAGLRGPISQQFCVHHGIYNGLVFGDPALQFNFLPVPFKRDGMYRIGIALRAMGKTGEPQYTTNEDVYRIITEICKFHLWHCPCEFVFCELSDNDSDCDREAFHALVAKLPVGTAYSFLPFQTKTNSLFSSIGQMDYLVCQRLHPTIIGWLANKPHVALDYQNGKTADFMASIGMSEFCLRTDDFSLDTYSSMHQRLMAERDIIIEQTSQAIVFLKERQLSFGSRILGFAEKAASALNSKEYKQDVND